MSEAASAAETAAEDAKGRATKGRGRPRHTRIEGSKLMPDPMLGTAGGSTKRFKFWIGVIPECPREHIDICGVHFPKITAKVKPSALTPGLTDRVPQIGAIVELTEDKFSAIMERIPRTVIRFLDGNAEVNQERGELGEDIQRRKGHIITIPTEEELEQRRKAGRSAREYIKRPGDVGAAAFIFMHLCKDQDRGERGSSYPYTLDTSGAHWPDQIED